MKKINSKMLQKSFDLKKSKLSGGIGAPVSNATHTECQIINYLDNGCKEITSRFEDDFGMLLKEETVETVC